MCVCTVYPSQCRFISRCLIGRKGKRIRELRHHQQQFEAWGRIESTHCMLYYSYITKVHGCTFEVFYPVSLTSFVFFYLFEIRRFDPVCEARSRMHLLTYTHKQTLRVVVDRLLSVFYLSVTLLLFYSTGLCFICGDWLPPDLFVCLIIFWFEYYSQLELNSF